MRILFLDDNHDRHHAFRSLSIGHVVDHAYTARQAIDFLRENRYDLVSLDHDLDWQATAGLTPLEETGYVVADFIAAMESAPTVVNVHSLNPVGAARMMDTLQSARKFSVVRIPHRELMGRVRA